MNIIFIVTVIVIVTVIIIGIPSICKRTLP